MRTSRTVTIEDAARYDGEDAGALQAVAGDLVEVYRNGKVFVTAANGRRILVEPGQWVVRYGPGDVGVMDDGEYARWFGEG